MFRLKPRTVRLRVGRRWVSSTQALRDAPGWGSGAGSADVDVGSVPAKFPWREAPPKPFRLGETLQQLMRLALLKRLLAQQFPSLLDRDEYLSEGLRDGSQMAFWQGARAIFQQQITKTGSQAGEGLAAASGSATEDADGAVSEEGKGDAAQEGAGDSVSSEPIPRPHDVLEGNLADFYENAMGAVRLSSQQVFYELLGIYQVSMSGVKVMQGVERGDNLDDLVHTSMFWGALISYSKKLRAKELEESLTSNNKNPAEAFEAAVKTASAMAEEQDWNKFTIQLDMDLACQEIFFIKDEKTGTVVQGDEAVASRVHRIKLESSPMYLKPEGKADFEWRVIDLDGWLEGNDWWIMDLKKKVLDATNSMKETPPSSGAAAKEE